MWIALIVPWATSERTKTACSGALELEVGDVAPLAREQPGVLGAQHPRAEHGPANLPVLRLAVRPVSVLVDGNSHWANVPCVMP